MNHQSNAPDVVLRPGAACVELVGDVLTVANEFFRRTWRIAPDGLLSPESFQDLTTGAEWIAPAAGESPPLRKGGLPDEARTIELVASPAPSGIEADSLTATLTAVGAQGTLIYTMQIFRGARGVRMRLDTFGAAETRTATESVKTETPTGVEADEATDAPNDTEDGRFLDGFPLAPLHLRLTQVTLRDQTDRYNELVFEREWLLHTAEAAFTLSGCLFYAEDTLTGAGLIFLKEAPLPGERPVRSPHDLIVHPAERRLTLTGFAGESAEFGYFFVTLAYTGGTMGRIAAFQQYQRCLRPYDPARDGMFLSNTWGDRNRDARINADFIAQEIEAGGRLGVDAIQIDDGWEVGTTSNSVNAQKSGGVWEGFYAAEENFWSVDRERFPQGLEPLIKAARDKGMRFGLWFGPDSADDFAHWRRDADTILRLHREYDVDYFKMDGVKLRSKTGERNLHALFDAVLDGSKGRVTFDLDVTAESRPGYFGLMRVGPIFVENRYTDWRRYWPHQTLRNLWKLAHHNDPVRLRMEFLNHARNQEKYAGDPLAPAVYRPDYLFATVMFSSPLGWFETSLLPETYFAEAAPLIAVWKAHREAIFSGVIYPIGDAPDGVAWTGFVSVAADGKSAYLLLFRELNDDTDWQIRLPFLPEVILPLRAVRLGGDGSAMVSSGGVLTASIPSPQRFLFARLAL